MHPCREDQALEPHRLLTPEVLRDVRAAGLGVILWHEERLDELRALARLNVDGICTNTPDVLRDALEALQPAGEIMV